MSGEFNLLRFTAMLGKETRQILRDPSTLMIAFVLPMMTPDRAETAKKDGTSHENQAHKA